MSSYIIKCIEENEYYVAYKGNFELIMNADKAKAKIFNDLGEAVESADALNEFQGLTYNIESVPESL